MTSNSPVLYIAEYSNHNIDWHMYVYYLGCDMYNVVGRKKSGSEVNIKFLTRRAVALWVTSCIDSHNKCTIELREIDTSIFSSGFPKFTPISVMHYAYDNCHIDYNWIMDQLNILRDSYVL